ncbi:transmembrane protein 132D-like isoform X1 [Diadema antillarum]|uniref:transmembrane protein 132D-like isoform X1 n=2 Tax=Diadema antillarum TaxID=105358 RepID=UPI003A862F81
MARIHDVFVAFAIMQYASCLQGEANSRFTKRRLRRDAVLEDMGWETVDYSFLSNQDVFLLRDTQEEEDSPIVPVRNDTSLYSDQLIGSSDVRRTLLKASSGPFWVQEELFASSAEPFDDLSVQAHLLLKEISPFASSIDVLFSIKTESLFAGSSEEHGGGKGVQPCFRAMAQFGDEESDAVCSPVGDSGFCIAKVPILFSWYEHSKVETVDGIQVTYTIFPARTSGSCDPQQGNSASGTGEEEGASPVATPYEVGSVTLLSWDGKMDLVEDDPFVKMYIPGRRLGIREHFVIPITINRKYLDGVCTVKAKARKGISAVSVRSTSQEQWTVLSMVKQRGTFAMVTAEGLGGASGSSGTDSPEENPLLFVIEFEVLNDTATTRVINWRIDCNLGGEARASRFGTDITTSDSWIQAVVPIPKETSMTNTAILTGREVSIPLAVGVVTHVGDVMDATGHARCHSVDTEVLKVRRSCSSVYLDGSETLGSEKVDIQVSLQGHTATTSFSVWVPELPLRVALSDTKLSAIRGWKVSAGRQDDGIPEPDQMLNGGGDSKKTKCRLKYQQSKVKVYTRFYAPHANSMSRPDGKRIYLFGENLEQSVTHLVKDQITVLDRTIAQVEGTNILARMPGNTKIQILHPRSRDILGESGLLVAADKVNVATYMDVTLVSGMALSVSDITGQGSRVKLASVTALSDLFVEHQEAFLSAVIFFDDGSSLALQDISTNDYTIAITTLDPSIILDSPDSLQAYPGVIAMGQGSTTITLEVELPEPCMKRRGSTITRGIIPINVTLNNPKYAGLVGSEGESPPQGSDSLWRSLTKVHGAVDYGIVRTNFELQDDANVKKGSSVISSIPIDIDFNRVYHGPQNENREENGADGTVGPGDGDDTNDYSNDAERMSGIEIGMYVLLGVFSLAILAFMVNCVMFMARYRRSKRIPKTHQGPATYPQNWVLFGMHEEHPRISAEPSENIPLRHKDEEEGSSRDEAIGTESEVSVERHCLGECRRLREGALQETMLSQSAEHHPSNQDSQEPDCGVVLDCDDNEDDSLPDLERDCQIADNSCNDESHTKKTSINHSPRLEPVSSNDIGSQSSLNAPTVSNTNQSNNSCDVRITLNPSDESLHLKSGFEGMEYNQIVNYLDSLKESCT